MNGTQGHRMHQQLRVPRGVEPVQSPAEGVVVEVRQLNGFIKERGKVQSLEGLPNAVERPAAGQDVDDQGHDERARGPLPLRVVPGDQAVDQLGNTQLAAYTGEDRKSTRLNSSHVKISYA